MHPSIVSVANKRGSFLPKRSLTSLASNNASNGGHRHPISDPAHRNAEHVIFSAPKEPGGSVSYRRYDGSGITTIHKRPTQRRLDANRQAGREAGAYKSSAKGPSRSSDVPRPFLVYRGRQTGRRVKSIISGAPTTAAIPPQWLERWDRPPVGPANSAGRIVHRRPCRC